jgi:chemotaxis protein MotB
MKHVFPGMVAVLLLSLLAGCAELKQLRVENADQKEQIARLTKDGDACQTALKESRTQLLQVKGDLTVKDAMLKEQKQASVRIQDEMQEKLDSQQEEFETLKGSLTLTLVESILFDPGKAEVKKEGMEVLQKVAQTLKDVQGKEILVAGYTDNARIRGKLARTFPSNWELSSARAITVMRYLESQGIDPKIMSAVGYGEYRPVADNGTPEGRAKNRRMEIILMSRHN